MILPANKEYFELWPLAYPLITLLIATFLNHIFYHSAVKSLFEKALTNRQRKNLRKVPYLKRRSIKFMRQTINEFPQEFSPNIEKYHKMDCFSVIFGIMLGAMDIILYLLNVEQYSEISRAVYIIYGIFTVATMFWWSFHHKSRDKNGKYIGLFRGEDTFK